MNSSNQGFVDLHNPTGAYIVGIGFLLVMLIIAAGGIFSRMIDRENVENRRRAREAIEAAKAAEHCDPETATTQDEQTQSQ